MSSFTKRVTSVVSSCYKKLPPPDTWQNVRDVVRAEYKLVCVDRTTTTGLHIAAPQLLMIIPGNNILSQPGSTLVIR